MGVLTLYTSNDDPDVPAPCVCVEIVLNNQVITRAQTNDFGKVELPLPADRYTIIYTWEGRTRQVNGVLVVPNLITFRDVDMGLNAPP